MGSLRWTFPALLGILVGTLPASPAWPADPTPATRARAVLSSGLERIVSISADHEGGVWAVTDSGKLYHCHRSREEKQARVECVSREGAVVRGY